MPPILKEYMRTNLSYLAIGLIIGLIFGLATCKSCTKKPGTAPIAKSETKTTTTNTYKKDSVVHVPVLVLENGHIPSDPLRVPYFIHDTIFQDLDTNNLVLATSQYQNLLRNFYSLYDDFSTRRTFKDSISLIDSLGLIVRAITKMEVYQNRVMKNTMLFDSLRTTTIREEKTNTVQEKKRTIGFFGLRTAYGFRDSSIYAGAAFRLQFKSGITVGVNGMLNTKANRIIGLEIDAPLHFKKR